MKLPAVRLALACIAGSLIGHWFQVDSITACTTAIVGIFIVAVTRSRSLRLVASLLAVIAAMALWTTVSSVKSTDHSLANAIGIQPTPAVFRARVLSPVQLRPDRDEEMRAITSRTSPDLNSHNTNPPVQSLVDLEVTSIRNRQTWQRSRAKIRAIVTGDVSSRMVGDELLIYGTLRKVQAPTNPGATDFRIVFQNEQIELFCSVNSPNSMVLERTGRWSLGRALNWLSIHGEAALIDIVGTEKGPLAAALVLGRRQAVDPKLREQLLETGTIHLLSVSGLHVGMVAGAVGVLTLLLGWRRSAQVAMILSVCLLYTALTGGRPPVLRASILVIAWLFSSLLGRQSQPLNSIAVAAIILLVINPSNLTQAGTQLSFLAVITIVIANRQTTLQRTLNQSIDRLLDESRSSFNNITTKLLRGIVASLKMSFWVTFASTPLVWSTYHIVSPISVIANVLLMIPLASALVSGLLTATLGTIIGDLAYPFGWLCQISLDLMLKIIDLCNQIPAGYHWLPAPPHWFVTLFYCGIVAIWLLSNRKSSTNHRMGLKLCSWGILWCGLAFTLATNPPKTIAGDPQSLRVTFIDVGHGTSVLVQLPNTNDTWLYDAGRLGDPLWSISPIADVLWSNGIYHLDRVIISHADADHYNAVPQLLRRFPTGQWNTYPDFLDDPQLNPLKIADHVHSSVGHIEDVSSGSTLETSTETLWSQVLHPPTTKLDASDNANSIVLRIDFAETSIVLPGDLESPGTEALLDQDRPIPGGFLMAPHHGSIQENPQAILDWARPSMVIVSGGQRSKRPEVTELLSQRGAMVLSTADLGAIRVSISSSGQPTVEHWLVDRWNKLTPFADGESRPSK